MNMRRRAADWVTRKITGCLITVGLALAVLTAGDPAQGSVLQRIERSTDSLPLLVATAAEEPDGYRMSHYRAPTPARLDGATVVSTNDAKRLWEEEAAIFIDVLPRPPKPKGLPEDVIWRPPARYNIPGSVWLPNVGFGKLLPELEVYFRSNLDRLSGGDMDAALLFYCLRDCWMSWNAAKRALELGHRNIYWYPEGTDGWSSQAHTLEESEPVPMQP